MKKLELTGAQKLERIHLIVGGATAVQQAEQVPTYDKNCTVCGLGGPILTSPTETHDPGQLTCDRE